MKNKLYFILNMVFILFVSIFADLYQREQDIIFKTLASVGFVILGAINLVYAVKNKHNLKFPITMLVALFFAMLGDILLDIEFLVGAIFFAIGHIGFIISYFFLEKFHWLDAVIGGALAICSALLVALLPIFNFGSVAFEVVIVVYAVIISLMLGKAISNFARNRNLTNLIVALGSLLFFVSDLMLLLGSFGGINVSCMCLATYYPAEVLLSLSVMFAGKEKETAQIVEMPENK